MFEWLNRYKFAPGSTCDNSHAVLFGNLKADINFDFDFRYCVYFNKIWIVSS